MNKTKFFIVSIQRDYIVRFHAQAEDLFSVSRTDTPDIFSM